MNSITWAIYLSDLTQNVAVSCGVIGAIFCFAWVIMSIFKRMEDEGPASRKPLIIGLCLIAAGTPLPSKQTVLLMIASEASEAAVKSEIGQEVIDTLRAELRKMREKK